ncbi:cyclophilin-like fold protein [Lactobacillus xylocopicola]|uniref:cyclophilin-like fold protein n=1 Tax=Lactobacillus xylocopicola TaxID=2976676 RepID=UPI00295498D8|nr:cyclophilin-like fold protein [Lactobacillus xylocopicola]
MGVSILAAPAATLQLKMLNLTINGYHFTATLTNNSSAQALVDWIGPDGKTLELDDYAGMEKVGELGTSLPCNDQQTTTQAGDLILYQGDKFVIYYGPNSWNFTRLGQIDNLKVTDFKQILGNGGITVKLTIN